MTGLVVLKMVLMPSSARLASLENSGPRWSMMGVSMARRMRSGRGVGPGICRKWRPAVRDEFLDMALYRPLGVLLRGPMIETRAGWPRTRLYVVWAARLAAMKDECDSQSSPFSGGRWAGTQKQTKQWQ